MPDLVNNRVLQAQEQQKTVHDKTAKDRQFVVDDYVIVQNYAQGPPWVPAHITEHTGPGPVSYKVTVL